MKILLASSEVHPYSKTGGLGDMVGAMAKFMARAGHTVAVVTPLYRGLKQRCALKKTDIAIDLPLGSEQVSAEVWTFEPLDRLTIYFIDRPEFYDRAGLYAEGGVDYPDNAARFIFFSKCAVHLAKQLQPDIVHGHDWQAGLVPLFIVQERLNAWRQKTPATMLTIHNLAYQGNFPRPSFDLTNLPKLFFSPQAIEFYGYMSCLKAGILYADSVTTVSPRYANEIATEEFGCSLDGVLRQRNHALAGILNGVDYDEWNTEHNPYLPFSYSKDELAGKTQDKCELQKEMGLPVNPAVPLFANITRLVGQKGVDILVGALEQMLATDMQFVLLGSGDPHYASAFQQMARQFPDKFAVFLGFDPGLAHRIEAGADFFVMPSRFEPCGLNQMYSLRYGTIPIVRAIGGLDNSVIDIREDQEKANGIKFHEYTVDALAKAIYKAQVIYKEPELLAHYRRNALEANFSWQRTVHDYLKIYRQLLEPKYTERQK